MRVGTFSFYYIIFVPVSQKYHQKLIKHWYLICSIRDKNLKVFIFNLKANNFLSIIYI